MQLTTDYSLENGPKDQALLLHNGQPTGLHLDGRRLEAQFETPDQSLLWLADDSPYDEGLHIYLLDTADRLLDAVEAGADFTPGMLRIHDSGDKWVLFSFFSNDILYRLDLLDQPVFQWRLPSGWRYKQRFQRHWLRIQETNQEASHE